MEHVVGDATREFIGLTSSSIVFLLVLGFLGGLISGFIGSGGAFVLTPGMMSLGVPACVAVASNMCHKFPKAMIGSYKRNKYGQVDIKLGLIMGLSAIAGVQIGIRVQQLILDAWGEAGSNLYVSLAFVTILSVLGIYMLFDSRKAKNTETGETTSKLAQKVQKIKIRPMIKIKNGSYVSMWVTIPIGLGTGMLAATIAVGGFVGVPGMIYLLGASSLIASGTELLIAFVMGLTGAITWATGGFVDIRMTLLILAGSLFGVQVGAIGTTYVKDYMVKFVMAVIMVMVAVSRGMVIPGYLHDLGVVTVAESTTSFLSTASFIVMCLALATGGLIILGNMWLSKRRMARAAFSELKAPIPLVRIEEPQDY